MLFECACLCINVSVLFMFSYFILEFNNQSICKISNWLNLFIKTFSAIKSQTVD